MKIDVHTHILPPEIPKFKDKFGYGGFVELKECDLCKTSVDMYKDDGSFFRTVESNCINENARLEDMDTQKVTQQVLSTLPVMFSYFAKPEDGDYVSKFTNDHIAGIISKKSERFLAFGSLPMQDSDLACRELERCVNDLAFSGVQIGSHINGKNLNDPSVVAVLEAAQELNAAVFVHPWDMLGGERTKEYWMPWLVGMPTESAIAASSLILGGVLEKLPRLKIGFAHGGGAFAGILGRISHGYQCRPDLVAQDSQKDPRELAKTMFYDSLVHDEAYLEYLVKTVGINQIMLGTDYPFPLGEEKAGALIEKTIQTQEDRDKLLFKNAQRFLGLK